MSWVKKIRTLKRMSKMNYHKKTWPKIIKIIIQQFRQPVSYRNLFYQLVLHYKLLICYHYSSTPLIPVTTQSHVTSIITNLDFIYLSWFLSQISINITSFLNQRLKDWKWKAFFSKKMKAFVYNNMGLHL